MSLEIKIAAPELTAALNNLAAAIGGARSATPAPTQQVASAPVQQQAAAPTPAATPAAAPVQQPATDPNAIDGPTLKNRIINACRSHQGFATEMQELFAKAQFDGFDKVPAAQYPMLLKLASDLAAKHGVQF